MKKTDKIIVTIITIAAMLLLIYGFSFYNEIMFKSISIIGGCAYMFFILLHLGLLFPLIFIVGGSSEIIKNTKAYKKINNISVIISGIFLTIIIAIILIIVYYGIPIILCMMYNNSFSYTEACNTLSTLNSASTQHKR